MVKLQYQCGALAFTITTSTHDANTAVESHDFFIQYLLSSPSQQTGIEPICIGKLKLEIEPLTSTQHTKISWNLIVTHTPTGESIDEYFVKDEYFIQNDEESFKWFLKDISDRIYEHYKDIGIITTLPTDSEPENKMEETKQESANIRGDIKITNVYYDLSGVPSQAPSPRYELEVDLRGTNMFPNIKTALLTVCVQYESSTQQFHANISTEAINGVYIQDLNLNPAGSWMEIQSIYTKDSLKQIDFRYVVHKYLRQVNSQLELCRKILNSNLDQC